MKDSVVEVGPGTVRGSRAVDETLVSTALQCIDDEIALFEDQPVAVAALWRAVFRSVLPDGANTAVLVCPTWWPPERIERVQEAAATASANVVAVQRAEVAGDGSTMSTVVEIAADLVVIWRAGDVVTVEPRIGEVADVARAVAHAVGSAISVVVDAPVGVDGAVELSGAITECLRADGAAVTTLHPDRVLATVRHQPTHWARWRDPPGRGWPRAAAVVAVVVSVALLCAGLTVAPPIDRNQSSDPATVLVEGRVAMKVPAQWLVRRVTTGPGSARVEVTAPGETVALHLTQSQVRNGESLPDTAAMLRRALDDQQAGIFDRFNPDDRRAGRPAVTYRELRGVRQIDWAVLVDDTVRIAVGCQSPPGREEAVRDVCEDAIRSVHKVI